MLLHIEISDTLVQLVYDGRTASSPHKNATLFSISQSVFNWIVKKHKSGSNFNGITCNNQAFLPLLRDRFVASGIVDLPAIIWSDNQVFDDTRGLRVSSRDWENGHGVTKTHSHPDMKGVWDREPKIFERKGWRENPWILKSQEAVARIIKQEKDAKYPFLIDWDKGLKDGVWLKVLHTNGYEYMISQLPNSLLWRASVAKNGRVVSGYPARFTDHQVMLRKLDTHAKNNNLGDVQETGVVDMSNWFD